MTELDIKDIGLQAVCNPSEFAIFKDIVATKSESNPNILGVLVIGSFIQRLELTTEELPKVTNPKQEAYEVIRARQRRRMFPSINSDLDIWVMTTDEKYPEPIKEDITARSIELIDWLANNPHQHMTDYWTNLKQVAFGLYYKNPLLYSKSWNNLGIPWNAESFKTEVVREIVHWIPDMTKRINRNFTKKLPGSFLEVRAFPQSTFNLRPEELMINGDEDRTPFPRIMNQDWISRDKNTIILYAREGANLIYPFNQSGEKLGSRLEDYINEKH